MAVYVEKEGPVTAVVMSRPEVRNGVDRETAAEPALWCDLRVMEEDTVFGILK